MNSVQPRLGIIHASHITIPIFQKYARELLPDATLHHIADDTIQAKNNAAGPGSIPQGNFLKFANYAASLQDFGVDLIVLACSTFNQAVEYARPMISIPMMQIDKPMMQMAVRNGSRIGLLATLPSTVPSSMRLLQQAADEAGKQIQVHETLCSEAFVALQSDNRDLHNEILLDEIRRLSDQVDCIVLAQISMTALESCLTSTKIPVYNSGRTGFLRMRELFSPTSQPS